MLITEKVWKVDLWGGNGKVFLQGFLYMLFKVRINFLIVIGVSILGLGVLSAG